MSLVSVMVGRASSGGLDKPAAVLAAFVVGAAVFVMPGSVLEQAVLASGLPDSLPQLSPPLGIKSRAGLALLAAGSAFGMVLLMMRILGFLTKKRERPAAESEGTLRVRRRDQHPDAPFRGPLSVSRDLGEPAAAADREAGPAPEAKPQSAPVIWPEPEPAYAAPEPIRPLRPAGLGTRRRAPLIEVLAAAASEGAEPEPAAEEPRRIKASRDAEPEAPAAVEEPAQSAQAQPEPPFVPEFEPEPDPIAIAQPVAPVAEPPPAWVPPAGEPSPESLTDLLARFERALERKSVQRAPAPAAAEPGADEGEGMDLRLRSALENLRKFAPRHG
ncbi:MAG TPA: hypothetical protein VF603_14285 [Allosphingosinicella sp.]|jgi:hypothetical protein